MHHYFKIHIFQLDNKNDDLKFEFFKKGGEI